MDIPFSSEKEFLLNNSEGKTRYYVEKMGINNQSDLEKACAEYVKGMEWIYKYYFFGCASWSYYFPYFFAPFMGDLCEIEIKKINFDLNSPLLPYEQLISV